MSGEGSDITALKISFDFFETLGRIQHHQWSAYDLQYLLLLGIAIFSLSLAEMPLALKLGLCGLVTVLFLLPITNQFFWPGAAIWTYLLYFFTSRYVLAVGRDRTCFKGETN